MKVTLKVRGLTPKCRLVAVIEPDSDASAHENMIWQGTALECLDVAFALRAGPVEREDTP